MIRTLKFTLGALLAAVALTAGAAPAKAAFVTFNGVPASGNPILTSLDSEGFRFTSEHFHSLDSFGNLATNGTIYIGHEGGSLGRVITMTKIGGGTFSISSFDGAELWVSPPSGFPNATRIQVVGTLSGGGTLTAN